MDAVRRVESFEALKVLADERRLAILRQLMAGPATLSQLGQAAGKHPAWIRHHLKQLERVGLVELAGTRALPGFTEKYYRATARAFHINALVTPSGPERGTLLALGSHDPALDLLAERLRRERGAPAVCTVPLGSLDGLIALRQGSGHFSGCHLLDTEREEYNAPYVSRLFPGQRMALLTLARRQQGLLVAPGNPLRLRGLEDLAREDITFVNRPSGSGTRIWLDRRLHSLGIPVGRIRGYHDAVRTHTEVAATVAQGRADAGLGVLAAGRAAGLEVVPLFEERFDLVFPEAVWHTPEARALVDAMRSKSFGKAVSALGGYDTAESGQEMWIAS